MRSAVLAVAVLLSVPADAMGQSYVTEDGKMRVALVKMPYSGSRNVPELSRTPDYLAEGGIEERLTGMGVALKSMSTVALTPEEQREYGEWHRLGLLSDEGFRAIP